MHWFRSFTVIALLAVLIVGCSKKDVVEDDPGLTQTEADDLVQQVAAEAAVDSGGWFLEVTSTLAGTPLSVSATSRVLRDTIVTRHDMTWHFNYTYYNQVSHPDTAWGDTAVRVEAITDGRGTLGLATFAGTTGHGTFRHRSESFTMEGLTAVDSVFNFTCLAIVDSGLFTIQSPGGTRYYLLDNIVTYELDLPKRLADSPFSVVGEARVNVFASVLQTISPSSRLKLLDAVMVITFDGTDTPLATITADTDPATAVYRYRINLRTGAITRA